MRIVQLSVGTGNHYMGSTVRDQALCSALRRMGHQVHFIRVWDDMLVEDEEYWRYGVALNCKLLLTARTSLAYRLFGKLLPKKVVKSLGVRAYNAFYRRPFAKRMRAIFELDDTWGDAFTNELNELVKSIRKCDPHLIFVTGFPPRKAVEVIRERVIAPVILTLNGTVFDLLKAGVKETRLKEAIELADGVVSPSQYLLDEATSALQPKFARKTVIHTGFMLNFYSAREVLPPQPVVGYLGGLDDRNALDELIDAVYALRDRGHAFTFIILSGANPEERAYVDKRLVPLNDGTCSYRCLQYLSIHDKTQIMEQFSVLALPGARKAFGNAVVEAMAVGIPVVQPRSGPYPEIIKDGETGVLFDPNEPQGLANALERMITDRALNKKIGHDARVEAVNRFSSERMTGEMLDFVNPYVSS